MSAWQNAIAPNWHHRVVTGGLNLAVDKLGQIPPKLA